MQTSTPPFTSNNSSKKTKDHEPKITDGRRVGLAICLAIALLLIVELGLQLRSHLQTGKSIFQTISGKSTFVMNSEVGVRALRPFAVIRGEHQVIQSNRYGLRDKDFDPDPAPGERRIALLGASTIMGAYARTNSETSSAALERQLAGQPGFEGIRVINSGLDGTTLDDQVQLLGRQLGKFGVTLVIWYPGTNDIGCKPISRASSQPPMRLPWPNLSSLALTNDLIVKNTSRLRASHAPANQSLVQNFYLAGMRSTIERGIAKAKDLGITLVLVTSATSYRSEMPPEEITRRASSALFFRPCYTGPELAASVDAFNAMLRNVGDAHKIAVVDAAHLLPANPDLFGDASHFSPAGEERFAKTLATELTQQNIFSKIAAK